MKEKKIKQRKFKKVELIRYRWRCKNCKTINYVESIPWHDNFITCEVCWKHFQVTQD